MEITTDSHCDFYSVQLPLSEQDKQVLSDNNVIDLEQELVSYAHTGALLQQMDLVVSVCTSVVHLAGALNISSIVLLSPHADWRWLMEEERSTWYPNTSILRQQASGDWSPIIQRAKEMIEQ